MQKTVDARGLNCPTPVIKTKKALEDIENGNVLTIVDNEMAKKNITKLVKNMKYDYHIVEDNGEYFIDINKNSEDTGADINIEEPSSLYDSVILAGSDVFGEGDRDLGEILINGYFYALSEMETYPKAIVFLNSAVKLTTEGSKVIKYLRDMEAKGVEIISCGTCLDFYNLSNKLLTGGVSNMYTIVEVLNNSKKVVRL